MADKSRSEKVQSALGAFRKGYTLGGVAGRALSGRGRMAKKVTEKLGSTGAEKQYRLEVKTRRVGTGKQEAQRKRSADYPSPPVVKTGPRAKTPATKPVRPTASATRGRVKRPTGKAELPAQLKGRLKSKMGYGQ